MQREKSSIANIYETVEVKIQRNSIFKALKKKNQWPTSYLFLVKIFIREKG